MTLFRIWNFGPFGHHTNISQQAEIHTKECVLPMVCGHKNKYVCGRVLCEDKF